jgi:hypothetical protein
MGKATLTTDHDEIRAWVEARGGRPARVKGTGSADELGVLRIDFPGFSGADPLEPVPWDAWFEAFEDDGLAFLAQSETADGELSRFNVIVSREEEEDPVTLRRPERSQSATR